VEGRSTDWIATFLEPLTFMRLRHTVVTMLYRAGATVPEIGGITGHTISSDVVDTFTEPGASALDEDRPAFQDMIDKATAPERPYDFIVVHSLSRFSRDTMHSEFYVRKLRRAGVQLVSMTQELGENGQGDLIRKIFNAFDEHQSRENAKHPGHAGERPAGFWNGAVAPFGYATVIKERRGNKDKKVLVVREDEARMVRQIIDMYLGVDGPPKGLKAIVNHLNERGITRRGRRFGVGSLQDLLTTSTYCGRHYFNKTDSRTKKKRPRSEWVEVAVPAIIDGTTFDRVQAVFRSRARVSPRPGSRMGLPCWRGSPVAQLVVRP
jgi:site-specific DNA recombinase